MPIKLMVRVRPGVELTCASFCPSRELIRLDFPTFDRPRKANSGAPAAGKCLGSAAEARNLAWMGFMLSAGCFCGQSNLFNYALDFYTNDDDDVKSQDDSKLKQHTQLDMG